MHAMVIGGGLLGVTTAYYLRREGIETTVIERQPGAGLETSFANAGYLQAAVPAPWNEPGIHRALLRSWLASIRGGSEDAPVLLRTRALPGLISWGLQFLRNSQRERYLSNTVKNFKLAAYSLEAIRALRAAEALEYEAGFGGAIFLFRSPQVMATYQALVDNLAPLDVQYRRLDGEALVEVEPSLRPIAADLLGALHFPNDEAGNAHLFCRQLAELAARDGVEFRYNAEVQRLEHSRNRIEAALVDGERLKADVFVLAAGCYSPRLARPLGVKLPIAPAKGYSISVPMGGWNSPPRHVVGDMELHAGITPLGNVLRVAGTAEFTGFDLSITEGRVRNLVTLLEQIFPEFVERMDRTAIRPWAGLRPMCPDGVPIIGRTSVDNLFLNTGHGALGWTLATGSSQALARLMAGKTPDIDLADYSLGRF